MQSIARGRLNTDRKDKTLKDGTVINISKWRTPRCMRQQLGKVTTVHHSSAHKSSHYGGLFTCGSVHLCPVCAIKILTRRGQALGEALSRSIYTPVLVTYTIQHSSSDSLKHLYTHLSKAFQHVFVGKARKRLYAQFGVAGYVRAFEVRHAWTNGWHPHFHQLLLLDPFKAQPTADEIYTEISKRYKWYLEKHGFAFNSKTLDVRMGQEGGEQRKTVDQYLTKWGLELEMAAGHIKSGKSLSPFQLLRAYSETQLPQYSDLFLEYAAATKGKPQLQYTNGLKKLLGIKEKTDMELATEQTEDAVLMAIFNSTQWRRLLLKNLRGEALLSAESLQGDVYKFLDWCVSQGIVLPEEKQKYIANFYGA